jgi:hypothetical protein
LPLCASHIDTEEKAHQTFARRRKTDISRLSIEEISRLEVVQEKQRQEIQLITLVVLVAIEQMLMRPSNP